MTDEFVTVYRSTNPIEAEIMEDLLGQEGMEPRLLGTRSSALLGVTDNILSLRIEVPAPLEKDAQEVVKAILASPDFASHQTEFDDADDAEDAEGDENIYEDGPSYRIDDTPAKPFTGLKNSVIVAPEIVDDNEKAPIPKKRYVTFGIAFLFPGLAHFYLGRYWTGFLLVLYSFIGYYSFLFSGQQSGVFLFLGVPLCDILFTQWAFPKPTDPPYSIGQQLLSGTLIGAALFSLMAIWSG